MVKTNEQIIIETMKDKKYLKQLSIRPLDIINSVVLAQKELRELENIVEDANKNNESLSNLCDRLKGHNKEISYNNHNNSYFDLNYKSLLVTIIQSRNQKNELEPIKVRKDDVYIYPDNITKTTADEMFALNLEKQIDFNNIIDNCRDEINKNNDNMEGYKKFFNVFKAYLGDIDSLTRRLQDNFNFSEPFVQEDQDRLALCLLLDLFAAVEVGDNNNELFEAFELDTEENDEIEEL